LPPCGQRAVSVRSGTRRSCSARRRRRSLIVRSPYDGLISGAFTGLGLQISEDILSAFNATSSSVGADQVDAARANSAPHLLGDRLRDVERDLRALLSREAASPVDLAVR
jgi:hypothetical protein